MLGCLIAEESAALPLHAVTPAALDSLLARLPPAQAGFLRGSGFKARAQELRLLPGENGLGGAVLGLGDDPIEAASPWAFGGMPMALPEDTDWRLDGAPEASRLSMRNVFGRPVLDIGTRTRVGWSPGAMVMFR